ncbi:glycoside hydrolase family 43 protein [Mesorhizobium sp. RP14(2022)]|uniref:Glycoside hydrolase family 43 protein n=1 Tax=Mesorhizobium liriopis TaxID=2953882 RepID=A0ABT1C284_9HYPH|nr:glycoside hydrolase family 43 protein [Mesorhizobium liriopis]MCO6048947.1 glycoside hydrolase family 43 protein [Mesorhizobium liriopis]
MTTIRNPILRGFNPDPSICRVGEDYFIATSTFEWYPGVQIHHSRDLANWTLLCRPLSRAAQLDMRGNPDSGGIWAPCLSHADGLFWLVYTDVKRLDGSFKDGHNYIVTAPNISGPWSDPIYANSSGFDPSLFHDDDGRKWFVNMLWNHVSTGVGGQPKHPSFAGILLQEYDPTARKLVGPIRNIFRGSAHGLVEGPHLFKREGWYYLTTAEGGTGYDHAVTMARSREIAGPYELHPDTHLITSKDAPEAALQRAGHGQIVETPDGAVYHTHLCSRPLPGMRRSPLGRETAIQKCEWGADGWLRLVGNGPVPRETVPGLEKSPVPDSPNPAKLSRQTFQSGTLPEEFQWLRTPYPERIFRLGEGGLTLIGRESLGSWFEQALVARRQEHFAFRAETEVHFAPDTIQQAAGLIHYYNRAKLHFIAVAYDETLGRVLQIMSCPADWPDCRLRFPLDPPLPLPGDGPVRLRMEVDGAELQFFVERDGAWRAVGPVLDASLISDEAGTRNEHGSFTGAFVGMAAFDTSGAGREARFGWFAYEGRDG